MSNEVQETPYACYIAIILLMSTVIIETINRWEYISIYFELLNDLWTDLLMSILCVLTTVALIATRDKSMKMVLLICTPILLITTFHDGYTILVEYVSISGTSIPSFITGSLEMIIALFLTVNFILYSMKASSNTTVMFFAMMGIVLLHIVQILTLIRGELNLHYILRDYFLPLLPIDILTVMLMLISRSKSVRSNTFFFNIKTSFEDIRKTTVPIGMTIERSILEKIHEFDSKGLYCERYEFMLQSYYHEPYRMLLFRKDGKVYAKLGSLDATSGMDDYRFVLRGILMDTGDVSTCDTVRFYDDKGFYIQLILTDGYVIRARMPPGKKRAWYVKERIEDRKEELDVV
jgi:hypothetical protein